MKSGMRLTTVLLCFLTFAGCTSSETVGSTSGPEPPASTTTAMPASTTTAMESTTTTEDPILDYSAIEGRWVGVGEDDAESFSIDLAIEASARPGRAVGTVTYVGEVNTTPCEGGLTAVSAEHPVYVVRDNQPDCPNGIIELTFDEETGNLIYTFTDTELERWDAHAVLEPANR